LIQGVIACNLDFCAGGIWTSVLAVLEAAILIMVSRARSIMVARIRK
jgi:hypothetical protein